MTWPMNTASEVAALEHRVPSGQLYQASSVRPCWWASRYARSCSLAALAVSLDVLAAS